MTLVRKTVDAAGRVDRVLRRVMPAWSHAHTQQMLRKRRVAVLRKGADEPERLRAGGAHVADGDVLLLPADAERAADAAADARRTKKSARTTAASLSADERAYARSLVLYEDERVVVINKPSGLAVQGGTSIGKRRHVDALLPAYAETARLVHRLDKETSGCLLIARDVRTAAELSAHFRKGARNKAIQKRYLGLVIGAPASRTGRISAPVATRTALSASELPAAFRAHVGADEEAVPGDPSGASPVHNAITEYCVIDSAVRYALLEMIPLTGRKHQLRVHTSSVLGTPLVGDQRYGRREGDKGLRLLLGDGKDAPRRLPLHLHALSIRFPDLRKPLSGRKPRAPITVRAPLPDHMRASLRALQMHAQAS